MITPQRGHKMKFSPELYDHKSFLNQNLFDDGILSWKGQPDPFLKSRAIVSLLDMIKFYAGRLFIIVGYLDSMAKLVQTNGEFNLDPKLHENIKPDIDWLQCTLCKMGLPMSTLIAQRIRDRIVEGPKINNQLKDLINELHSRIMDEIDSRYVFILSLNEKEYYNPDVSIFGILPNNYDDMMEDIVEAGNCFALGRYTACVFHLMRVMEKALQKYANKLGISESFTCNKEWQKIINAIRGQLNILYAKHKSPDRIEHESILGHLETVKIAWRNPTMHPKATYTEEEGRAILSAVEIFIKDLVKIL